MILEEEMRYYQSGVVEQTSIVVEEPSIVVEEPSIADPATCPVISRPDKNVTKKSKIDAEPIVRRGKNLKLTVKDWKIVAAKSMPATKVKKGTAAKCKSE